MSAPSVIATTITSFGPDPPLALVQSDAAYPGAFACITGNASSEPCDEVMGSLAHGLGFCADPKYASTTYCACVNSPTPDAACFFAPCANSGLAYRPVEQRTMVDTNSCPKIGVMCNQILAVGGRDNIVSGNTMQCGIITNVQNIIKASPYLTVLLFVLVLLLVMVIAMRPDDTGGFGTGFGPPIPSDLPLPIS